MVALVDAGPALVTLRIHKWLRYLPHGFIKSHLRSQLLNMQYLYPHNIHEFAVQPVARVWLCRCGEVWLETRTLETGVEYVSRKLVDTK